MAMAIDWAPDASPLWPPDDNTVQVPTATRPSVAPPRRRTAVTIRLSAFSSFRTLWDLLTELGSPDGSSDLRLVVRDRETMMRFYTQQHRFYSGVDLHARTISLCVLDASGAVAHRSTIAVTRAPN